MSIISFFINIYFGAEETVPLVVQQLETLRKFSHQ